MFMLEVLLLKSVWNRIQEFTATASNLSWFHPIKMCKYNTIVFEKFQHWIVNWGFMHIFFRFKKICGPKLKLLTYLYCVFPCLTCWQLLVFLFFSLVYSSELTVYLKPMYVFFISDIKTTLIPWQGILIILGLGCSLLWHIPNELKYHD